MDEQDHLESQSVQPEIEIGNILHTIEDSIDRIRARSNDVNDARSLLRIRQNNYNSEQETLQKLEQKSTEVSDSIEMFSSLLSRSEGNQMLAATIGSQREILRKLQSVEIPNQAEALTNAELVVAEAQESLAQTEQARENELQVLIDIIDRISENPNLVTYTEAFIILTYLRDLYTRTDSGFINLQSSIEFLRTSLGDQFPELLGFDLNTDEEVRRQKIEQILPTFYTSEFLDNYRMKDKNDRPSYATIALFRSLRSKAMQDLIDKIKTSRANEEITQLPQDLIYDEEALPNRQVFEEYMLKHSPNYLGRLNLLLKGSNKDKSFLNNKKVLVAVAAMNETSLLEMIQAFKDSYSGNFDEEVAFVIYHNYKDTAAIRPEVRMSVNSVKELSNVLVVEEEVPQYNTTGMAKKLVSDIAITLQGPEMNLPLIMADADISSLTPDIIDNLLRDLDEKGRLAAAPEFDYDDSYKIRYPVLGLIWDVRREIAIQETLLQKEDSKHITYGMCYAINPRVLAMIGGIKPTEQFEDKYLTEELKETTMSYFLSQEGKTSVHPVAPSNTRGCIVRITPDREIMDLRRGNIQWRRWITERSHSSITGESRNLQSAENDHNIPELAEFSESNIAAALNKTIPFVLPQMSTMSLVDGSVKNLSWQSREVYLQLRSRNVTITEMTVITVSNGVKSILRLSEDEIMEITSDGHAPNWVIKEIHNVRFA